MDTRDQTLTKLTWLHGNYIIFVISENKASLFSGSIPNIIQPITVQQAYDGITHAWWWASWNWWWRKVDGDDGAGFPSLEPRTDTRSALPREIRAWRRLHIVKCDESFSLIFFSRTWIYIVGIDVGGASGGPTRQGARPAPSWIGCGTPGVDSFASIFY